MSYQEMGFLRHVIAALALIYVLLQWVTSVKDFAGGVARFWIWWSRDVLVVQRAEEPRQFWTSTVAKALILSFGTAVFLMLLLSA